MTRTYEEAALKIITPLVGLLRADTSYRNTLGARMLVLTFAHRTEFYTWHGSGDGFSFSGTI